MEEVLEVYERPYDASRPVVCLDESPKQLIGEKRIPFEKQGIKYIDYEYIRNGVTDIYMIVEPKGGYREVLIEANHNHLTYGKILLHIANDLYPNAAKITLVNDNLSAHKPSVFYELMPPAEARSLFKRFEFIYTPTHGSWLNIAECELSVLTRQGLDERVPTKEALQKQATEWYENRNRRQMGVDWQFTTKDARIKLKRLYPTVITE
jgi:DDE superfamily endonuclease